MRELGTSDIVDNSRDDREGMRGMEMVRESMPGFRAEPAISACRTTDQSSLVKS